MPTTSNFAVSPCLNRFCTNKISLNAYMIEPAPTIQLIQTSNPQTSLRRGRLIHIRYLAKNDRESSLDVNNKERKDEHVLQIVSTGKMTCKKMESYTYLAVAVISSMAITSMASIFIFLRLCSQFQGSLIAVLEVVATSAMTAAAALAMEFWARWAHGALWHASLWNMHESHHRPRDGLFELNDVFAVVNAIPAIILIAYGSSNRGLIAGLSLGAGRGMTLYGIAYMFVHDGLIHRRFPIGALADLPYLTRIAAAHQIHHSNKFEGVPYGLFMGPNELQKVGGDGELNKELERIFGIKA